MLYVLGIVVLILLVGIAIFAFRPHRDDLTGTWLFSYSDGSKFVETNQYVLNMSQNGTISGQMVSKNTDGTTNELPVQGTLSSNGHVVLNVNMGLGYTAINTGKVISNNQFDGTANIPDQPQLTFVAKRLS